MKIPYLRIIFNMSAIGPSSSVPVYITFTLAWKKIAVKNYSKKLGTIYGIHSVYHWITGLPISIVREKKN